MIERNIEWLLVGEKHKPIKMGPSPSQVRKDIPYPPDLAKGHSEQTFLFEGITVVQEKHFFISEDRPERIPLGTFEVDLQQQSLVISVLHSGSMEIYAHDYDQIILRKPNLNLFVRSKKYKITITLDTEEDIELTVLMIPEETLVKLLGVDGVKTIYQFLKLPSDESFNTFAFPISTSEALRYCVPSSLEEKMRNLYAQTRILQHLFDINLHLSKNTGAGKDSERKKLDIKEVHQYLLQVAESPPTLTDLSMKYGASPATLSREFIKHYKESIYSFLSNQRLDQAYQAIVNSEIPMKVIAHRIGYSHVNHFITAFKKKFGVTPGSLRKF